jgi:hypothetical protein
MAGLMVSENIKPNMKFIIEHHLWKEDGRLTPSSPGL